MTVGSYVYFGAADRVDQELYSREDSQGGLTSVVQVGPERVMLSNGKFQGGNKGEVPAQIRFALTPMLFTRHYRNALVIGLGTGNTLRSISRFPFERLDAVELAPAVVDAARLWFQDVNGGVLDSDPRVHLSIADGRNFLLLSENKYDLITIELTSIWISGEADLYNREFYELCRTHMGDDGVLQQWVQIHHMRLEDFLLILNTAARVFPYVAYFQGPEQGLLVASASPLVLDYTQMAAFDHDPQVRSELKAAGVPSMASLLGEIVLYGDSLQQALSSFPALSRRSADFTSTDYYPALEYETPKANVLPHDTAAQNLAFLKKLRPPGLPAEMAIQNLPSSAERELVLGYVLERRGELEAAAASFDNVTGPAQAQARIELERIGPAGSTASP
jgi:spermidine synthase